MTTNLFRPQDSSVNRSRHRYIRQVGSLPVPITTEEWVRVSEALLAAGLHDLQDALNRRRTAILDDITEISRVASEIREQLDPRKVCSFDVRAEPHVTVTFSGHGSFAPDGHLREMVAMMDDHKRWVCLAGVGDLAATVHCKASVYCG